MTTKPILVLTEPFGFSAEAKARLAGVFRIVEGPFDRAKLLQSVGEAKAIFVRFGHRIDAEFFDRAPMLVAVASPTTGVAHIEEAVARARGISIVSLRGEQEFLKDIHATAEHTLALILSLLRRIPAAHISVCNGAWDRDRFRGRELHGRILGIVGLGRVGSKVAAYARAFQMSILACEPNSVVPNWAENTTLADLCSRADIVSLHAPSSPETANMIAARELSSMKGALLINTARGDLVNEADMIAALESRNILGAALDVLKAEHSLDHADIITAEKLKAYAQSHDNLILTPHIGGATTESMAKTEMYIAERLIDTVFGPDAETHHGLRK